MQWHGRLGLQVPPASKQAFTEYLEKELQVTPDAAPFSGESHWWTHEIVSPVLGGSAATAAAGACKTRVKPEQNASKTRAKRVQTHVKRVVKRA